MPRSSEFNGAITGRIIAGSHMETGATMNNYFGSYPIMQGRSTIVSHKKNHVYANVNAADGSSRKREPFSTVPFSPDHDFVDRPEILAWIHDKCAGPGARAALAGLGGVGKSQLAIRYANNIRDVSPQTFVLWVHASTKARFEEAYRGIADRLELPGRNDPKVDVLRLVSNWLCDETHGRWIMILDNADDVEVFYLSRASQRNESFATASARLVTYLPQSRNGSILITSRSKDVAARLAGNYNNIKEVHAMGESQALYLFRNKLQSASNEEGAADLLRALDYIPLAITQAAAFINRRGRITASGYLDEFRKNDKKKESLLSWDSGNLRRDGSASNSVVLTWQMSFECIHEQRRSATDLLSLMSLFNPQGIPEWILRKHSKSVAKTGDEAKDNSAFDEDLDTLQAYSLIIATADGRMCGMHALVQFCTRAWLSTFSNPKKWDREFLGLMAREFPLPDFKNWAKCQQLLPHVESLYESDLTDHESVMKWALVLNKAARYIQTALGKYDEAEKLCRRVLEGCKKELGEQHPNTLTSVGNLALVLQDQGKHGEAEKLNRLALQGLEKKLGKRHPNTLTSVGNLASALQDQGKYNEAEKLCRRALEGCKKELGEQHPNTLTSVGNLALVLQDQGKHGEAEKLNRLALEGFEKELGEQHPDTLTSVYNLAYLLHKRKRYVEASGLYQRACNGYKQKLGTQHRTTIACLNSFSAMQREAEQEGLGQSRTLINNGKAEHRETSTHSFTSLTSSGTTPKPVDSKQKSKQGSLYARLKRRIAEMTYGI